MGIDIYMSWDDITEKEKKLQYTGYDISKGHVGYLRIPYWNITKHQQELVKILFGIKYFDEYEDYELYDFTNSECKLPALLPDFMKDTFKIVKKHKNTDDKAEIWKHNIIWLNSLLNFLKLGIKLQRQNKHPKILISG